jgi:RNA polymerase sigma-70 factor (ECF subfamily)
MSRSDEGQAPHRKSSSRFVTTRWTLVVAAADPDSPESRDALATLCQDYWYPLYVYARRRGNSPEDARDLTQGFFAKLLEKNYLKAADRKRGKFRTFLLTAMQGYMANEWDRKSAQKRGGGQTPISLDIEWAEGGLIFEPVDDLTPEAIFEKCWALAQFEKVVDLMRAEMSLPGKEQRFELLKGYVTGDGRDIPYRDVAQELGVSESSVKVAVHRMRKRFGELLRQAVAETVAGPDSVEEEIRHLLSVAAG